MNEISLLGESVEQNALAELHAAAPEETRQRLGLRLKKVGTALVSVATRDPNILLNRTIGLGVEAPDTPETVKGIVSRYADKGVGRYFLHLHPEARPPELLDWAATLPAYRGRGGQGVVLCQRIRDALDLGCRGLLTTTGEAVEGDPQHSYRNIERVGFRPIYTRENFVPAG